MAEYFAENSDYGPVRLVGVGEPITGGVNGTVNHSLRALVERDNFIFDKVAETKGMVDDIDLSPYAKINSPVFTGTPQAPTAPPGTNSGQLATTAFVQANGVPVGTLLDFAGQNAPNGFLLCDGRAVSRTQYAGLFAVLGSLWGAGDGHTTFNIPDCRARFAEGASSAGGYVRPGLPNIIGTCRATMGGNRYQTVPNREYEGTGAIRAYNDICNVTGNGSNGYIGWTGFDIDARRSSAIYGNSDTVQPASYRVMKIIKY